MLAHSHDCLGDLVMKLTTFLQALALTVCLPLQASPAKWCDADQNWCHISLETKSGVTLVLDYRLWSLQGSGSNYRETYIKELWFNAYLNSGEWAQDDQVGVFFHTGEKYKPSSCEMTKAAPNRMTCSMDDVVNTMVSRKFVPTGVYFPSPHLIYTQSVSLYRNGIFIDPQDTFQFVMYY